MADKWADTYGLPKAVFRAQIRQESGWNPKAGSRVGAKGLCQMMPQTARKWGVLNPHDPNQCLPAMAKNMRAYYDTYLRQGRPREQAYKMALAAYNAGPGAVKKHKGIPPYRETKAYVKTIMQDWEG